MYAELKYLHMLFIGLSILLFNYRFILKNLNKPIARWLKIMPHINDSLLLITGIYLAYIAAFNPIEQAWLAAKIIALFVYISFGMMALKASGITSKLGFILAICTFIFIVFTAINKIPFTFGI